MTPYDRQKEDIAQLEYIRQWKMKKSKPEVLQRASKGKLKMGMGLF